jgi:predicted short-subunit dehydrogenase-like oxidoreductase (DUF2520 family)
MPGPDSAPRCGSRCDLGDRRAGHTVVAASGVSKASRDRADRMLPGVPLLPADEVAAAADLVLLAVPDDTLAGLVGGLAETGAWRPGQIVAHTSGAHGLDVLTAAAGHGVLTLALHPAMTFTGRPEDLHRLTGVSFGITAPEGLEAVAAALVVEMGGEPVTVAEELRPLYHAALVVGANHLVTLVADSMDMLRQAGVSEPGQVLGPLLGAALDNSLRYGDGALTGPVSRGDAGTVRKHLATLATHTPAGVSAYVAMARRTADRAIGAGRLAPIDAEGLLDVLAGSEDTAARS